MTRFRAVEGYSLFITVKSDDDMKVEFQGELLQRKYKETFTARIDLTLTDDYPWANAIVIISALPVGGGLGGGIA